MDTRPPGEKSIASTQSRVAKLLLWSGILSIITVIGMGWPVGGTSLASSLYGALFFFPVYVILFVVVLAVNGAVAMLLFVIFHKQKNDHSKIIVLAILNVIAILVVTIPAHIESQQKTRTNEDAVQQNEKEKGLSTKSQDIIYCDGITENYYYWQSCINLSRTVLPLAHTPAESLAICLQQAGTKHFAFQPENPTKACQQVFGQTPQ